MGARNAIADTFASLAEAGRDALPRVRRGASGNLCLLIPYHAAGATALDGVTALAGRIVWLFSDRRDESVIRMARR
jgi:hypothetical protein